MTTATHYNTRRTALQNMLTRLDWSDGFFLHLTFRYRADASDAQLKTREYFDGLAGWYQQPLIWAAASSPHSSDDQGHHVHALLQRPDTEAFVKTEILERRWNEGHHRITEYDPDRAPRPESYVAKDAAQSDGQIFSSKSFGELHRNRRDEET